MTPTDRLEADRLAGFIDIDDEVSCNPRARAELEALRARVADLEMIARKSLDYQGDATLRRHGVRIVLVPDIGAPIYMADDGTGLPVLTHEARRALTPKETA